MAAPKKSRPSLLNQPTVKVAEYTREKFTKKGVTGTTSSVGNAAVVTRLTDPSISKNLTTLSAKIKSDPKFALGLLQKTGIATKTGRLAKRYGG